MLWIIFVPFSARRIDWQKFLSGWKNDKIKLVEINALYAKVKFPGGRLALVSKGEWLSSQVTRCSLYGLSNSQHIWGEDSDVFIIFHDVDDEIRSTPLPANASSPWNKKVKFLMSVDKNVPDIGKGSRCIIVIVCPMCGRMICPN